MTKRKACSANIKRIIQNCRFGDRNNPRTDGHINVAEPNGNALFIADASVMEGDILNYFSTYRVRAHILRYADLSLRLQHQSHKIERDLTFCIWDVK